MQNIHGKRLLQKVYLQLIIQAESLYGADISTHPKHRHEGIGGMLYEARKELVTKLNLRRMIAGGRLFNYTEHADRMSPYEYARKVMKGELKDPVLTFELGIGFRFVKNSQITWMMFVL
jgi:hypothetical protein